MKPIMSLLLGFVLLVTSHLTAWAELAAPKGFQLGDAVITPIQTTTSISQHGITWTFAEPVGYGQFVNGDYWVVGPVTINSFTPASVDNGTGRIINGSEINPNPNGSAEGYDSSMSMNTYSALLNVAFGVSAETPLIVPVNSSLVSTISMTQPLVVPQIKSAAVLTVLSSPPPANSFRPPYAGSNKTISHNETDINYNVLGSLAPTSLAPSLSLSAGKFAKLWLDYRGGAAGRMMHPSDNMPNYGREMSTASGEAALLLNCNFTNADKRDLMIGYLQWGVDLWGVIQTGFNGWWQDGGHGGGRKFPVLFAGTVLGNSAMAGVGTLPYNNPVFGEDQSTFYLTEYEATRWLGGDGKYPVDNEHRNFADAYYTSADWTFVNPNGKRGLPEYGKYLSSGFQGRWISRRHDASYRECCHVNSFTGWILATYVMGLKDKWNHDALFDYTDRYIGWSNELGSVAWTIHMSPFAGEMWRKYREVYKVQL